MKNLGLYSIITWNILELKRKTKKFKNQINTLKINDKFIIETDEKADFNNVPLIFKKYNKFLSWIIVKDKYDNILRIGAEIDPHLKYKNIKKI
jgi:hypothetical protein